MSHYFRQFIHSEQNLYVTEFGHSILEKAKTVGPRSRGIYLLHFVITGHCDFSGFRAGTGQAFLISRNHLHKFVTSDCYEHFWIGFAGTEAENLLNSFRIDPDRHQLFYVENSGFAQSFCCQAEEYFKKKETEAAGSLALSLLSALFPLLKSNTCKRMPRKADYPDIVKMFIDDNFRNPITMADIARELYLSEKYMYQLFQRRFQLSPQKYLLQTRMEAAGELLDKKGMTIKEIASEVGYTSYPSFSKAFTKYFSISPSDWRKQKSD